LHIPGEEQSSFLVLMLLYNINHAENIHLICFQLLFVASVVVFPFVLVLVVSSCTAGFFFTSLAANTTVFQ